MRIRPMVANDAAAAAELATELGYPSSNQDVLSRLHDLSDGRHHAVFVADLHGQVMGWVHITLRQTLTSPPHAEVAGLVVSSQKRGTGVGRALMRAAEDWARRRGLRRVRLKSHRDRQDAHRFYEGLGYSLEKISHSFVREMEQRGEQAIRAIG